jgi:inosine-uridine nucleoside N-ribohydrolase
LAELHQQHPSAKVMAEEIRAAPGEVTIIAGGPLTNVASAFRMEPDLAMKVGHLIIVGGTLQGPGDVTAAAEFNLFCDAAAAQSVLSSHATMTLLPVDVARKAALTLDLVNRLPSADLGMGKLLRTILPRAFQAFRQRLGLECFYAPEVVAVAGAVEPDLLTTQSLPCHVEIAGELTHGASVIDRRTHTPDRPNADVVVDLDVAGVLDCIYDGLSRGAGR